MAFLCSRILLCEAKQHKFLLKLNIFFKVSNFLTISRKKPYVYNASVQKVTCNLYCLFALKSKLI